MARDKLSAVPAQVTREAHERWGAMSFFRKLLGLPFQADTRSIRRELAFKDFYRTMSFVNAVAHVANIEDHHPDLEVGYNYCRITFTTHAIKGLSENDFICAAKIDSVPRV